jgi:hypothetical protein
MKSSVMTDSKRDGRTVNGKYNQEFRISRRRIVAVCRRVRDADPEANDTFLAHEVHEEGKSMSIKALTKRARVDLERPGSQDKYMTGDSEKNGKLQT